MRTQNVIIRDYWGRPRLVRVWHTTEAKVYVTSEEGIQRLQSGCKDTIPIGFDRDNVFVFNGDPLPDQPDWSKVEKWE